MFSILSPLTNCSEQQVQNLKDNVCGSTLLFILSIKKRIEWFLRGDFLLKLIGYKFACVLHAFLFSPDIWKLVIKQNKIMRVLSLNSI